MTMTMTSEPTLMNFRFRSDDYKLTKRTASTLELETYIEALFARIIYMSRIDCPFQYL